jgi:hypothetical protein
MSLIKVVVLVLAICLSSKTFASGGSGGGTLVGNGAGIVEQNIIFAYDALPRSIDSCLSTPQVCGVLPADVDQLQKIRAVAAENRATSDRIQFVSEQAHPGFFNTEEGQAQRLAKTGNTAAAVIFWNSDLFYQVDQTPALDMAAITAIWVHELGHQAGNPDHSYLDQLGARIRLLMLTSSISLAYNDAASNTQIQIKSYNYSAFSSNTAMYLSDGNSSYALSPAVKPLLKCSSTAKTADLIGWTITNMSWDSRLVRNGNNTSFLPFTAWVKAHCLEDGTLHDYDQDVHFHMQLMETKGKNLFTAALPSLGHGE